MRQIPFIINDFNMTMINNFFIYPSQFFIAHDQMLVRPTTETKIFHPEVNESKTVVDSGFQAENSGFQVLDCSFVSGTWIPDPNLSRDSGFQKPRIPFPHSLRSRRLEVVGERENRRARRRHARVEGAPARRAPENHFNSHSVSADISNWSRASRGKN